MCARALIEAGDIRGVARYASSAAALSGIDSAVIRGMLHGHGVWGAGAKDRGHRSGGMHLRPGATGSRCPARVAVRRGWTSGSNRTPFGALRARSFVPACTFISNATRIAPWDFRHGSSRGQGSGASGAARTPGSSSSSCPVPGIHCFSCGASDVRRVVPVRGGAGMAACRVLDTPKKAGVS